jgi:biopolymer transport protein ExbD
MIDVMMFLLVFFVLISIDVIPAFGVKTRLPSSSGVEANIGRHNAIVSLGRNGELQLDGIALGAEELVPRLLAIRQDHPQLAVIINGDQSVELQRVIDVMDRIRQQVSRRFPSPPRNAMSEFLLRFREALSAAHALTLMTAALLLLHFARLWCASGKHGCTARTLVVPKSLPPQCRWRPRPPPVRFRVTRPIGATQPARRTSLPARPPFRRFRQAPRRL